MFKFDYVDEYKSHYLMFMYGVEKYSEEYHKKFLEVIENEENSFRYLINNNDELTNEELLEDLYKSLDYLLNFRNDLTLNDSYKIKNFYDQWIVNFERALDNTKEKIRLRKSFK